MLNELKSGIPLERSGELLPWGKDAATLRRIGKPEVRRYPNVRDGDSFRLEWSERIILGGLEATIVALLRRPRAKRTRYSDPLYFRDAGIFVKQYADNAIDEMQRVVSHLDSVLECPSENGKYNDGYMDLPYAVYTLDRIQLFLVVYERFTLGLSFSIKRLRKNEAGYQAFLQHWADQVKCKDAG